MRFKRIALCDLHQRDSSLTSFLSDEGFDKIVRHMREAGKSSPVRKHTTLIWEVLEPNSVIDTIRIDTVTTANNDLPF